MRANEDMKPLCMIVWMPKVKGWLLGAAMAVAVAALMWARRAREDVFEQRLRKLES